MGAIGGGGFSGLLDFSGDKSNIDLDMDIFGWWEGGLGWELELLVGSLPGCECCWPG